MAKKDINTVGKSAAMKVGTEVLNGNPGMKEVYVTSDGTAFYGANDAHNHARTLANKSVEKITRAMVNGAADKEDSEAGEKPASQPASKPAPKSGKGASKEDKPTEAGTTAESETDKTDE